MYKINDEIYKVSDDEIKIDDWVVYDTTVIRDGKEVVLQLVGQVTDTSEVGKSNCHYRTTVGDWHCDQCKKIIETTNIKLDLPKLSQNTQ